MNNNVIYKKDIKTIAINIVLLVVLVMIAILIVYGVYSTKKQKSVDNKRTQGFEAGFDDDEVYHVNEKTTVDFYEPIIEQFKKESQLVVSSADASIDLELKQKGVFDVDLLNKTQKIRYKGTGRFYVEMSELSKENIAIDEENKTITITVPHTKLLPLEIDPNRFESEDAKKGFLAFGDLKFTPKEYNDLETEVKGKLEKSVNTKENRLKADENAREEITKIYDPIVKALDSDYSVNVEFEEKSGGLE